MCTKKLWSGGCADSEEVAPSIPNMEPQHVCWVQHIGGVNPSRQSLYHTVSGYKHSGGGEGHSSQLIVNMHNCTYHQRPYLAQRKALSLL